MNQKGERNDCSFCFLFRSTRNKTRQELFGRWECNPTGRVSDKLGGWPWCFSESSVRACQWQPMCFLDGQNKVKGRTNNVFARFAPPPWLRASRAFTRTTSRAKSAPRPRQRLAVAEKHFIMGSRVRSLGDSNLPRLYTPGEVHQICLFVAQFYQEASKTHQISYLY